jgi:fatty acid desaturase
MNKRVERYISRGLLFILIFVGSVCFSTSIGQKAWVSVAPYLLTGCFILSVFLTRILAPHFE